jgi:hypothetical protein
MELGEQTPESLERLLRGIRTSRAEFERDQGPFPPLIEEMLDRLEAHIQNKLLGQQLKGWKGNH